METPATVGARLDPLGQAAGAGRLGRPVGQGRGVEKTQRCGTIIFMSDHPEDDPEAADTYDYPLPADLIAQEPLADRAAARLLVVNRTTGSLRHAGIRDLPGLLAPGDLLVVNNTQVVPARLVGHRAETGGRWEGLFLAEVDSGSDRRRWSILAKTRGRPVVGERIVLTDHQGVAAAELQLVGRGEGGTWLVEPVTAEPTPALLGRVGRVPLPGYIRGGEARGEDVARYQTVFAEEPGSAAAPTAGLHFTPEVLAAVAAAGVEQACVTLHVGLDTFRPLSTARIAEHPMHSEWCEVPEETAAAVRATRRRGGRVVAVGTTAVRSLETAAQGGTIKAYAGSTRLFIRPGFSFHAVDCLLTNFHMPRTTLMVLVSSLAGRGLIQQAYAEAIASRYRFLSYGDAMLIV